MPEYTGPQETTLQPDEDMMTDHLGSWFGNIMEGQIDIGWMNTERGGITNFKRFDVGDFDEAAAFAAKTNAVPGQSVYYRPAVVKPDAPAYVKDADVMIAPGVWVDLDNPGAVKTAKATYTEAGLPPTGVVVTGREPETRAHLYWAFTEYRGASDITKRMNQSICTAMGGDPASVNVSRLMRLGGTIAWPWKPGREPEMTSFKRINKGGPYADTRLKAAWPIEQPKLEIVPTAAPSGDRLGLMGTEGVDLKAISELILKGENWHLNMVRATGYMVEAGRSTFEIQMFCRNYTLSGYSHADTDREVLKAVNGAREKWDAPDSDNLVGSTPAVNMDKFGLTYFDPDVLDTLGPRKFLYGKYLIRGFVSITLSPGGAGKTTLELTEAVAMALGLPLLGKPVKKALKVAHYNLEDPLDELQRRVWAICSYFKIDPQRLRGRLLLNSGRDHPLIIAERDKSGIIPTPYAEEITKVMIEEKIDVLQVDPFIKSHRAEENDNTEVDQVLTIFGNVANETRAAVDLVHHVRKAPSGVTATPGDMNVARGASAITGAVRAARTLAVMTEKEAVALNIEPARKGWYVRVDNAKNSMSKPLSKVEWFERHSVDLDNADGEDESDDVGVLVPWTPPDPFDDLPVAAARSTLLALERGVADGQMFIFKNSGGTVRWAGEIIKNYGNKDAKGTSKISDSSAGFILNQWRKDKIIEVGMHYNPVNRREDKQAVIGIDHDKLPGHIDD